MKKDPSSYSSTLNREGIKNYFATRSYYLKVDHEVANGENSTMQEVLLRHFYAKDTETDQPKVRPKETATKTTKKKKKRQEAIRIYSLTRQTGDFDAATLIWISNRWPGCICLTFGVLVRDQDRAASEKYAVGIISISISSGHDDSRLGDPAASNLQKFVKRVC